MDNPLYKEALQTLMEKQAELKECKKVLRDIENDLPMELEELNIQIADLKKQAKDAKDEHLKALLESNTDYVELREKVQACKEEEADAKVTLFTAIHNATRDQVDLDETVVVEGAPCRLQTQREVSVYVNGKILAK